MNMQSVEGLQRRTDAKIRYARVHFEELRPMRPLDSSDFGRAHQESFLFHLFGARDALIAELNVYYGIGLPPDDLTAGKLRSALESRGLKSPELVKLRELEDDEASWFRWMKDMRDHSTHRQGVARAYFMSGLVKLKHPATGQLTERDLIDEFEHGWFGWKSWYWHFVHQHMHRMRPNPAFNADPRRRAFGRAGWAG